MWVWGLTPGVGVTYDPEGLLSTLGAIATTLVGIVAGEWLQGGLSMTRKATGLAVVGLALLFGGSFLDPLLPINKRIWTSTFALFSGGVALLLFAALYFLLDVKRWRWWTPPALIFGANAIAAFALSNIITVTTDRVHVRGKTGHRQPYISGAIRILQLGFNLYMHRSSTPSPSRSSIWRCCILCTGSASFCAFEESPRKS